uniref:Peptidase M20 dimerisation domain-containing protein n=1 Tax=Araucaria cunninghamii TaxID=56994 RepID=A0A0D6R9S6_ARACU
MDSFVVLRLLLLSSIFVALKLHVKATEEDATEIQKDSSKIMQDFSGYPEEEFHSHTFFVDKENLQRQVDELSAFSDSPAPSVTRILYSENDVLARRYVKGLMEKAGLVVREDAVGNIFGRWKGTNAELPAIATGSHTDAIPYSGKYDGVVGVLGAIEAINVLKRLGFNPKRSLEVIMFTSEEPTRFGISCLGSRLMSGSRTLTETLKGLADNQNISFAEAAKSAGYLGALEYLDSVSLPKDAYSGFVELHIEQGPLLEEEGIPIGIVTAIAAPASIKVDFIGNGGHAGAVLMPYRNDAGLAAAELALAVEKHVLESGSVDTVGTTGVMEIHPGAVNSIPSKAHVEIDTRDIDEERRNAIVQKINESAEEIAKNRKVILSEFNIVNQDPPAHCSESIIKAMEDTSKQLNLNYKLMISRAYHDSLFMARISPMGMIFIPCYKGYSHRPDEYASIDHISNGVKVLALTLAKLSSS